MIKLQCVLTIVFLLIACPAGSNDESCVQCHTNGTILESLVTVPKIESGGRIGPAGKPAPITPGTYYKRYLVDKSIIDKDMHLTAGCSFCHKGDNKSFEQEKAHAGVVKRPSADLKICGDCHGEIRVSYENTLHYTAQGMLDKISRRLSKKEEKVFTEKAFGQSCRSCHASCGDCHVSSPSPDGISAGLLKGHRFVKKDEEKTCGICHGGRVYPEYAGKFGGKPDVHFQKGMVCTDCHKKEHLHGNDLTNGKAGTNKPRCTDCHQIGKETKVTTRLAHARHQGNVTCYACHSQGAYANCYDCHIGKGSLSKSGFILGADPQEKNVLTTLRAIPITRETFQTIGIKMENFDRTSDYRAAPVHTIQKNTERTGSCDACDIKRKGFLSRGSITRNGSKANGGLIFRMPSLGSD